MSVEQELVKVDQAAQDSEEEVVQPVQEFKYYLKTDVTFKIATTKWGIITIVAGCCYLYEIIWTIAGVNNYTDISRNKVCGSLLTTFKPNAAGVYSADALAAASAIYDTPILLVTYWHMAEWIRWTTLLTCALVDANLIPLFYFISLVIPYGFIISILISIMSLTGADYKACADAQPERARYLTLQLVCFFLYFIVAFAQIWLFKIKGVDWCHEVWLSDGDDEEDD